MSEIEGLIEELAPAAARGVEVTILIGGGSEQPPSLSFAWDHKVYNDCAISRFRAAGYELIAQDCDGDRSWWKLKRGRAVLAEGGSIAWFPMYHFDVCLMEAEAALRHEVRQRIAALSSHKRTGPVTRD